MMTRRPENRVKTVLRNFKDRDAAYEGIPKTRRPPFAASRMNGVKETRFDESKTLLLSIFLFFSETSIHGMEKQAFQSTRRAFADGRRD